MRILPLLLAMLLPLGTVLAEEGRSCISPDKHTALTIFLVDVTANTPLGNNFSATREALQQMLAPGERLLTALIVDKRANTRVVFDMVKPSESVWESRLTHMKKQKQFKECLGTLDTLMPPVDPKSKKVESSAILETIDFTKEVIQSSPVEKKRIVIYSDMIQNSDFLSFYKLGPKDSAETLLGKVEKQGLIPPLKDVTVYVAGIGGTQTDSQARLAEQFWRTYFSRAGSELKFYGPVLIQ